MDSEFIERGHEYPLELISLGMVSEDNRALYRVLSDGWDPNHASRWVIENVFPRLGVKFNTRIEGHRGGASALRYEIPLVTGMPWATRKELAALIIDVVGTDPDPVFVGYFADYDWVILAQLFGTMMDLPKGFPMFCRDLKQTATELGLDLSQLVPQTGTEHNALADALHTKSMDDYLIANHYGP